MKHFSMSLKSTLSSFLILGLSSVAWGEPGEGTAEYKQDAIWQKIEMTSYQKRGEALPVADPSTWSSLSLMSVNFLWTTFTRSSDEMPLGRQKLIHTYGSVAKVEWVPDSAQSSYTGIFQSGGIGLARLSLAAQAGSYTPGMALKIFVEGENQPSVNFQVMNALDGQGENRNFFEHTFSNSLDEPKRAVLKVLGFFFNKSVDCLSSEPSEKPLKATLLPLLESAQIDRSGTLVQDPVEPLVIVFEPNPSIGFNPGTPKDLRIELAELPENTELYKIGVKKSLDSEIEWIGKLVTRGLFVASEYGDSRLFFQHQSHRRVLP